MARIRTLALRDSKVTKAQAVPSEGGDDEEDSDREWFDGKEDDKDGDVDSK